jgi:hypothetical protein
MSANAAVDTFSVGSLDNIGVNSSINDIFKAELDKLRDENLFLQKALAESEAAVVAERTIVANYIQLSEDLITAKRVTEEEGEEQKLSESFPDEYVIDGSTIEDRSVESQTDFDSSQTTCHIGSLEIINEASVEELLKFNYAELVENCQSNFSLALNYVILFKDHFNSFKEKIERELEVTKKSLVQYKLEKKKLSKFAIEQRDKIDCLNRDIAQEQLEKHMAVQEAKVWRDKIESFPLMYEATYHLPPKSADAPFTSNDHPGSEYISSIFSSIISSTSAAVAVATQSLKDSTGSGNSELSKYHFNANSSNGNRMELELETQTLQKPQTMVVSSEELMSASSAYQQEVIHHHSDLISMESSPASKIVDEIIFGDIVLGDVNSEQGLEVNSQKVPTPGLHQFQIDYSKDVEDDGCDVSEEEEKEINEENEENDLENDLYSAKYLNSLKTSFLELLPTWDNIISSIIEDDDTPIATSRPLPKIPEKQKQQISFGF